MRRLFVVSLVLLLLAGYFFAHETAQVVKAVSDHQAAVLAVVDEG